LQSGTLTSFLSRRTVGSGAGNMVMTGGFFDSNAITASFTTFDFQGGVINVAGTITLTGLSGSGTLSMRDSSNNCTISLATDSTFSGVLKGGFPGNSGMLIKTGNGKLTLTGNNTFGST